METPWLDNYPTRKWTIVVVGTASLEYRQLMESVDERHSIFVAGAEGGRAENHWKVNPSDKNVLYFDYEQIVSMDFDRVYGIGAIGFLKKEWMGHPAGSLIMVTYRGVCDTPPTFAVGVTTL
jgi:hypothetical protein